MILEKIMNYLKNPRSNHLNEPFKNNPIISTEADKLEKTKNHIQTNINFNIQSSMATLTFVKILKENVTDRLKDRVASNMVDLK